MSPLISTDDELQRAFLAASQRPRKMQDGPGTQLAYLAHHEFRD